MKAAAEKAPVEMIVLALTDEDLDRLFHCVRFARLAMDRTADAEEASSELRNLERFIGRAE